MEKFNLEEILELMKGNLNLSNISKYLKIPKEDLIKFLIDNKYYYAGVPRTHSSTIIKLHDAAEYFISHNEAYSKVERDFGLKKTYLKEYIEKFYSGIELVKKSFNENIFDSIDTEEKAYWLGFIYADGNINSAPLKGETSYCFEMTLSYKDIEHLRKFAVFVGFKKDLEIKNIKYKDKIYQAVRISLYSKHLWNTLNNYGCTPKKSLTLEFPDESIFKDKSLIRHFIRGYFDGDGTLGIYDSISDNKKYSKCLLGFLGTVDVLSNIQNYFIISKNIKSAASEAHPNKAFKLTYSSREAFYSAFCIYYNSNIYLERKYKKFMEFCRLYEELYRELSGNIGEDCDVNPEITLKIAKGFKVS